MRSHRFWRKKNSFHFRDKTNVKSLVHDFASVWWKHMRGPASYLLVLVCTVQQLSTIRFGRSAWAVYRTAMRELKRKRFTEQKMDLSQSGHQAAVIRSTIYDVSHTGWSEKSAEPLERKMLELGKTQWIQSGGGRRGGGREITHCRGRNVYRFPHVLLHFVHAAWRHSGCEQNEKGQNEIGRKK